MKKRVVSLLLCLVMLLSVFLTGCSEKTDEETLDNINAEASVDNITLSMWVVSEKAVSKETAAAVTAELNRITEEKLKTRLAITYYTIDQYEQKLMNAIKKYDNTAVAPVVDSEPATGEGFYDPIYPALIENQVDIVYIEGKEMYTNLMAKEYLASIENELTTVSTNKPLQEYVSTALFNASKLNGSKIYALPNNNPIGEYTYMLLNRDLMDKYYGGFNAGKFDTFYNDYVYNYLDTVFEKDNQSGASEEQMVLIDSNYEDCLGLLAHYWNFDSEDYSLLKEFSVFGHTYTDAASLNRGSVELGYTGLFTNDRFTDAFLNLNRFEADGYFGTAKADEQAAIKIVKCDLQSVEQYAEDYYPVILQYPTITDEEIYNNGMFGICAKSVSVSRSVEIITYINTNAEVRNTLLYGVKGVHYETMEREVDGESYTVAYKLNNDYQMSMAKTGNIFRVYPLVNLDDETQSMDPNAWANAKEQNYEALISPVLDFDLTKQSYNKELTDYLNALNADLLEQIELVKAEEDWYGDLEALVGELGKLLDPNSTATVDSFNILKDYLKSEDFANLITETKEDKTVGVNNLATLRKNLKAAMSKDATKVNEKDVYSPYGAYMQWLTSCGFLVKK